ncbi:MAG: hypothetical protein Hyperionvirus34_6 [Hyperionvirus sp.]|uniref:Uncharacterized protein n=1 Tax=Hyperionvirus sp. TaxID=2487770 RepID=A0A3G5AC15_9VIRU|nr:MAG: hypothetical protein Hyperionvirus34_6 [Hyperionvirus sp.]
MGLSASVPDKLEKIDALSVKSSAKIHYLQLGNAPEAKQHFFKCRDYVKISIYDIYIECQLTTDIRYFSTPNYISNKIIFNIIFINTFTRNVIFLNEDYEIIKKIQYNWDGPRGIVLDEKKDITSKDDEEMLLLIKKPSYLPDQIKKQRDLSIRNFFEYKKDTLLLIENSDFEKQFIISFRYETVSQLKGKFHMYINVVFDEDIIFKGCINRSGPYRIMLINRSNGNFLLFDNDEEKIFLVETSFLGKKDRFVPVIINLRDDKTHDISQFEEVMGHVMYRPGSLKETALKAAFQSAAISCKESLEVV